MVELKSLLKNDLNLLITLYVLIQEKSVTRAAERLFVTQPAISKSLSRLRDMFDDPLFTRASRGLVPTPLAEALLPKLEALLLDASAVFLPEAFDPKSYQGEIRIAVTESWDMMFIPRLVIDLQDRAPGLKINTRSHFANQLEALEEGHLDFVINLQYANLSTSFRSDRLLSDFPVVLARNDHPLQGAQVSSSNLYKYPRVALHLPDIQRIALYAEQDGVKLFVEKWQCAFETENLITALMVVANTDYLMPAPGMLSRFSNKYLPFAPLFQHKLDTNRIDYCLVSHKRTATSATHQWVRSFILENAAKFEEEIKADTAKTAV